MTQTNLITNLFKKFCHKVTYKKVPNDG
jgi:hypothetical protein